MFMWCSVCGMNGVDSSNKTTGKFYVVSGHNVVYGKGASLVNKPEEYKPDQILFAVCEGCDVSSCLKEQKENFDQYV